MIWFLLFWLLVNQPGDTSFPQGQLNLAVCDLEVDAGPDITICYPGGEVMLMGSVNGNYLFSEWSPSTDLSDPNILNPIADVSSTITYTLTVVGIDPGNPNLVENGDFESGNIGFTSNYTYLPDLPEPQEMDEGEYGVLTDPANVHWGWDHCTDHTSGTGNMMVLNAAPDFQNVWCQTITVEPNSWYNVAAWVASVHPTAPAILQFSINSIPIGPIINAPSATCQWVPFNAVWYSGSNTTASLCILNQNTTVFGNDFAIDDISMVELCVVEDEVTITVIEEDAPEPMIDGPEEVCPGDIATYTATFPPEPEILSYAWILPSGVTVLSGQGTTEITVIWDESQNGTICLVVETACDENEGCIDVIVSDIPDEPEIIGAVPLCPGESVFISTPENPDEEYAWTVSPHLTLISGESTNEIEVEWAQAGEAQVCLEVTNPCGSTTNCITVDLSPSYIVFFDTVLCANETIVINGSVYGNGVWSGVEDFITVNGCDSTVYVEIAEADAIEVMLTEFICEGDSIFLQGMYQSSGGTYIDVYENAQGCDSIVTTQLIVSAADSNFVQATTCIPSEAGIFISTFNNGNCDSIVILNVVLVSSDTTFLQLFSCNPSDTGQVEQLLANLDGCDSLVITQTTLLQSDTIHLDENSCNPDDVGTTIDTFTNLAGCDSIVILNVYYAEADTTLLYEVTCTYQDTGTVTNLYVNTQGCDSLVMLTTSYVGSDTLFLEAGTCSVQDTGWVTNNFQNQFGCDSIVSTYFNLLQKDTLYQDMITCIAADTGTVTELFTNIFGCDSLVITTTTLDVLENCFFDASISLIQPLCDGDTAWVNVDFLTGLLPFQLFWENGTTSGSQTYNSSGPVALPLTVSGEIHLHLISANGLSILDTVIIEDPLPLDIDAEPVGDYSGFHVPCYRDSVGEIQLDILSTGTPPLSFAWSHGEIVQYPVGLPAGNYTVTVTDVNGCIRTDEVNITEPPPLMYDLVIHDIPCFGLATGSLEIINPSGGVSPWMISIDGKSQSTDFTFDQLNGGNHELIITDQNNCTSKEEFTITEASSWDLELGPDTILPYGTLFTLEGAIFGAPNGALTIHWSDEQCSNCLTREIEVTTDQTFILEGTDENGCISRDTITVRVSVDADVFIPNVFTPNGDGVNDAFYIFTAGAVKEIEELSIYDRWGDHVFQRYHFQPNDPALGWDGKMRGKLFNPAVFAYTAVIVFKDGSRERRYGDVTLIR